MAFIIAEPCIGKKNKACVPVCPVDCIWWFDPDKGMLVNNAGAEHKVNPAVQEKRLVQLFIDPSECIDCFACAEACPPKAIFQEDEVPPHWAGYVELNRSVFQAQVPSE